MTRFESLTSDLSALAEFISSMAALDPWQDDDPWTEDGYDTCEEWLRAEEGEKGTYPWKKQPLEKTPMEAFHELACLNLVMKQYAGALQARHLFDGRKVEFSAYTPLVVDEDHKGQAAEYAMESFLKEE